MRIELGQLYTVINIPHVDQVHVYFLANALGPELDPGPETLEARWYGLDEIPWDNLAFKSVSTTLKHYLREHKCTTILVTHDQTEANALADRIAVMEGGVLQQYATPAELKARPANLFTGTFIGEPPMNVFNVSATVSGETVSFKADGGATLAYPASSLSTADMRLEAISDDEPPPGGGPPGGGPPRGGPPGGGPIASNEDDNSLVVSEPSPSLSTWPMFD